MPYGPSFSANQRPSNLLLATQDHTMFCLAVWVERRHGQDELVLRYPGQADPVGVDVIPGGQAGQLHAAAVIREQVTIPVLILVLHRRIAKTLLDLQILGLVKMFNQGQAHLRF